MKHTKKLLAAVMAFAMVSAIAPMSAFATNVTPDTDGKPSPASAGFEVKYDVDPSYTVTIPAGVDITTGDKTASITLDEGALLAEGTKIEVVLEKGAYTTTGNAFTAKTASGNSSASYQINGGNVKVGDVVASLDKDTLSADLTFSRTTTIAPTYAGTHTETLTFNIAVEEAVTTRTVTWNESDITGSTGKAFTKDGITITADMIDFIDKNFAGPGTFTTASGKFTKIEVTARYVDLSGTGWSGDFSKKTWTGDASSSVSFSGDIMGRGRSLTIVFTIEE